MSDRIIKAHLESLLSRVRLATLTLPFRWTRREDGTGSRCTVGTYMIRQGSAINGISWRLELSLNEDGAVLTILCARTARQLSDRIQSWLDGYEAGKRGAA